MSEKIILTGMVLPFDHESCDGRKYTKEGMQEAYENFQSRVEHGFVGGTINPDLMHKSTSISFENLSHKVTDVEMKDNGVYATLEVLGIPQGEKVKQLIEDGVPLYGTQVAMGKVQDGVVMDADVVTYNLTPEPSFDKQVMPPLILKKMI